MTHTCTSLMISQPSSHAKERKRGEEAEGKEGVSCLNCATEGCVRVLIFLEQVDTTTDLVNTNQTVFTQAKVKTTPLDNQIEPQECKIHFSLT